MAYKPPSIDEGEGNKDEIPQIPTREKLIGVNRNGVKEGIKIQSAVNNTWEQKAGGS